MPWHLWMIWLNWTLYRTHLLRKPRERRGGSCEIPLLGRKCSQTYYPWIPCVCCTVGYPICELRCSPKKMVLCEHAFRRLTATKNEQKMFSPQSNVGTMAGSTKQQIINKNGKYFLWNVTTGSARRSLTSIVFPFLMTSGCFFTISHPTWAKNSPLLTLCGSAFVSVNLWCTRWSLAHQKILNEEYCFPHGRNRRKIKSN